MSFRYKSALVSLVSLALGYGWYFGMLAAGTDRGGPARLVITILAIVAVQIVGHVLIAATSPDRHRAMDERERGFDRRATGVGYYVLVAGALLGIATLHLGAHAVAIANAVMLAIVVAECLRQAMFLILHHRAA